MITIADLRYFSFTLIFIHNLQLLYNYSVTAAIHLNTCDSEMILGIKGPITLNHREELSSLKF